jgi:hypothetical protein
MEMNKTQDVTGVPVTLAAHAARMGYFALRGAVSRGEVRGWVDGRGRWMVDRADLDRFIAERFSRQAASAAGTGQSTPA